MKKKRFTMAGITAVLGAAAIIGGCGGSSSSSGTEAPPTQAPTKTAVSTDAPATSTAAASPTQAPTKAPASMAPSPTDQAPDKSPGGSIAAIADPDSLQVIANKNRALPANYTPDDLVEPNVPFPYKEKVEKRKLRKAAADALEEMFAGASKDGLTLYAVSGYRSYATQKSLYNYYVETQGEEHASRYSAKPGTSEHQTGLAMDVSSESAGFQLEETFGTTAEGKWLAAHCAEYGFVIRYPNGKENITGYAYEPWHVRYVGKDVAQQVMAKGSTLEEFYQLTVPVSGN